MKGFVLGFLTAGAIAAGLYFWKLRPSETATVAVVAPDAGAPASEKRHRHRSNTASTFQLHPGDLRPLAEGDNLSTPDVINAGEAGGGEELPQDVIDARFHEQQSGVLACIEKARPSPDAPVTGKVVIKFRIQRPGTVRGVRVEAPTILMKNGLYGCIRPLVTGLHFPASGQSLVVTYPFQLD